MINCKTKIEFRSGVIDTLGRCHFFLNWVELSGRKRSQAFFANPEIYGHKIPKQQITISQPSGGIF